MKRLLLKLALQSQTYRVTRQLYRDRPIVLTYHGLTDERRPDGITNYHGKHIYAGTFRDHLAYLKRHYEIVSLDRLVDSYEGGAPLPPRAVILTFDDGYQSVHRLGFRLLQEFGAPAAAFLATDFVSRHDWLWTDRLEYALENTKVRALDVEIGGAPLHFDLATTAGKIACDCRLRSLVKRLPQETLHEVITAIEDKLDVKLAFAANPPAIYRPMEWSEAREMQASGLVAIGSHTASHVILARCSPARVEDELVTSRKIIETHLGAPCTLFCYPNGKPGCFDAVTRDLVRKAGYRCGLTTVEGMNDRESDVFELKRLPILENGDLDRFRLALSGMMGHLDAIQTSARRLFARPRAEA